MIRSPYSLDRSLGWLSGPAKQRVFFDGVFKGDYSLAIVNRHLARALLRKNVDLAVFTPEQDWQTDPLINAMPDVRVRCLGDYPQPGAYAVHLRNTWPPRADDMIGAALNAYVCFAWEEAHVPRHMIEHFNQHLDLMMVTATFVEKALRQSGLRVPIAVVGNGTDHILEATADAPPTRREGQPRRLLHVSSCFPRKGADVLVEAFAKQFSKRDNVELVIKTFDNPHNVVELDIARAKANHPGMAPITLLKQSLAPSELVTLLRSADALVAPSRGEGFGLPLAEAILLGVPVVTTGYSGQLDFCSDRTAWLVDYKLQRSQAHVSVAGAEWAEPDAQSLGDQMRRALSDREASAAKVARGQALLRAHFKWSDVATRVLRAVAKTKRTRRPAAPARLAASVGRNLTIDLVSTWQQVCGIATYSQHLFATPTLAPMLKRVYARELRNDAVEAPADGGGVTVTRPWGYDSAGIRRLEQQLAAGSGDILWFQHHPGFFSAGDMQQLMHAVGRSAYRAKVITLHNVRDVVTQEARWLNDFDLIVVHTPQDSELLSKQGLASAVVPHGILTPQNRPATNDGVLTIGTFGFLYAHKNVPLLVEALARARRIEPQLKLKLLNCTRRDPPSWQERARVEMMVAALGLGEAVEMDFRFLDDEEIIAELAACDVIAFPYGDSTESATGAARIALAADRPILCSRSQVLHDILPLALVLERVDAAALADAFLVLAASPVLRSLRDAERRAFVAAHDYVQVAKRHLGLFQSQLQGIAL